MPRRRKKAGAIAAAVLLGFLLVIGTIFVALLGGFFNHCRGGYVHFGPRNTTDTPAHEWYWPQHILSRLLFALPTGLVVILFGVHLRGSLVVMLLTWFSLYIGWGTYMNIGMDDNYCSRAGTFDWLIGRQAHNWTVNERFVREYSGMSLRGLMWTLPQGYVLEQMGFGWEYSLTGSVMPLVYFIGANTKFHEKRKNEFIDGSIAVSEVIWGLWLWFVLINACLSQAVRRARIFVYQRNPYIGIKPFSNIEMIKYESLNRPLLRAFYESFVIVLTILYCFTVIYYSLVSQPDIPNKGQTFFGLFTAVLFLVFSQAWMWSTRYRNLLLKRYARKLRGRTSTNNAVYSSNSQSSDQETDAPEIARAASVVSSGKIEHYEGLCKTLQPPHTSPRHNKGPLLSWPYSHPDRLSPTEEQRQQVLDMSEHLHPQFRSSPSKFLAAWPKLEKFIWLDIFVLVRRLVGAITLICVIFSVMITFTAIIIGCSSARFIKDLNPPCKPH